MTYEEIIYWSNLRMVTTLLYPDMPLTVRIENQPFGIEWPSIYVFSSHGITLKERLGHDDYTYE
jgi:hypothetical protein